MNELYLCTQQGRTLLFTLVMLLLAPLSMLTFGQSPCTSPVVRQATNGKSTNTNIYDDITIAMTNLLGNGTEAAWVMESGGTFTENTDGTAHFQCVIKQFGDYPMLRRFALDITLTGKSYTPDASGPYNQTGVPTDSWYYYYGLTGTLTGLDALAGGTLSLNIHMHPFQVGVGANQLFNAEDEVANGAGGWFQWTVVTQPTDPAFQFTDYISGTTISDIAILLSGTPSVPCPANGSIGDQVYCDINNNGVFDAGDVTVTGLTVTLCDANFVTIATQAVDGNGKYLFTNLPAGIYNVKFPETTLDGKPQRQLGPINVSLAAGQNYLDADKGYYKAPAPDPCLNDTQAPIFSNCPTNIVKDVTGLTGTCWAITWTAPTATDNCSTPIVVSNYNSGACLPVGNTTVTYTATDAKGNNATCSFTVKITKSVSCNVTGNTISKSCTNNTPVVTGTALANYEYMWLKSTTGCPSQANQVIAGANGQSYTFSGCTQTTYFVRCARPIGCTSWGAINESNCISIAPTDCQPQPTCNTNFVSTKCYRIVSKKSGKVLDVYGGGTNNDCPIIQWGYHASANEQWRLFSLGNGYFKVMARNSGKYLACHYTADASNVYQYHYYSGGYKDWKVECVGNTGYYRLVHRASGKCLDVSGSSTADGAKLLIYPWTGNDNQLFKIEEVAAAPASYSLSSSALAMNATAESDRVRLGWLSNTGYDDDFYTVEKMNDMTGDYEKLSLFNNTQFDDQVQTHAVYDLNPTEGDNFYRVKVTKNDGSEKLTDVKKVTFKRVIGFGAFPNPASDELNVNLMEYTGKAVDIQFYNAFGKVVSNTHIDNVTNPVYPLNINDFSAGQYLIRVSAEGKRDATQQVVIQK